MNPKEKTNIPTSTISPDRRVLGRKPNDYGVSSKAPIQRKYTENPSIAQKVINGITDALRITRPPTFKDGYGVERNAEVPLSESAQGQELKRMGKTAMNGLKILTVPTLAGGLIKAPLATAAMLGAGTAADVGTKGILNTVNRNLKNVKLSPEQINAAGFLASLPAMGAANRWGHAVTRRGLETIMHTSGDPNPAPEVQRYWKLLSPSDKAKTLEYVLTGKFTPGSNTLGRYNGKPTYYTAFNGADPTLFPDPGMDAVRTYLYKEPLKDLTEIKNPNYGSHENYILRNYPGKNVKVYEPQITYPSKDDGVSIIKASSEPEHIMAKSINSPMELFGNSKYYYNYDAAGHLKQQGLVGGELYKNEQDIWKFNPNDYFKRWLKDKETGSLDGKSLNPNKGTGWIKILPLKWGLRVVDHYGTPFIVRTPWTRRIERNSIINDNVPFNEIMQDAFNTLHKPKQKTIDEILKAKYTGTIKAPNIEPLKNKLPSNSPIDKQNVELPLEDIIFEGSNLDEEYPINIDLYTKKGGS